jgi:hypothetical protein
MRAQPAEEDQPEGLSGPVQPGGSPGRGAQSSDQKKTTQRGTRRLSHEERVEINRANRTVHGLSLHPLYQRHQDMIRRIGRPEYADFGITYYPPWTDVRTFIRDIETLLGPCPGKGWTLDRMDNDQGYFPGNLRWANAKMQANNRGHDRPPVWDGDPACLLVDGEGASVMTCFDRPCLQCPWPVWSAD